MDFSYDYRLNLEKLRDFVTVMPQCTFITTLNINGVYWIHVKELRKCIQKLKSLKELYVLSTQLNMKAADINVYSKLQKVIHFQ